MHRSKTEFQSTRPYVGSNKPKAQTQFFLQTHAIPTSNIKENIYI